jgi:hypothetical protein
VFSEILNFARTLRLPGGTLVPRFFNSDCRVFQLQSDISSRDRKFRRFSQGILHAAGLAANSGTWAFEAPCKGTI